MDVQERYLADNDSYEYIFTSDLPSKLGGMCEDNVIYIDARRDYREQTAIIAEEVAHQLVSSGDTLDYSAPGTAQSETQARRLAAKSLVPLESLVKAWRDAAVCVAEIADYCEVPEHSVLEAIEAYRVEYGEHFMYDGLTFDLSNGLRILE